MADPEAVAAAAAPAGVTGPARAYVLLAAITVVGGGNWVVLKSALAQIDPFAFAALSVAGAAAAMIVVNALRGTLAPPARAELVIVASVGLLQVAAYTLLIFFGLRYVDAGRSAILAFTMPIWVAPGAALFLGERMSRQKGCAVALSMIGVAVLVQPWAMDWSAPAVIAGNASLLAAALAWSVSILVVRRYGGRSSALALAPWQLALAAAVLVPLAVEVHQPIAWSPLLLAVLVWNALAGTAFVVWATVHVTQVLPAVTTSLGLLGVPVMATLSAAAVLGEPVTLGLALGLASILAANGLLALAEPGSRR